MESAISFPSPGSLLQPRNLAFVHLNIFQENPDEALKSPRRFRRRWTCPLNREFGNMSAGLRSQPGWNLLQNLATAELESVLAVVKETHLPSLRPLQGNSDAVSEMLYQI